MRRLALLAPCVLLAGCGGAEPQADAGQSPSTLVSIARPQRGSLPTTVEAYGTAAPAANGVVTLSVAQPGQVTAVPVVAGARVRAGEALVVFALAPSARASYRQATGALQLAGEEQRTAARLLGQQLATRDQLAQADKAVADAQAVLASMRAEGAGAQVLTLRAPFAGMVSTIGVAPGDRTQPGQALATVARSDGVLVTVGVDPALGDRLRPGEPVTLRRLEGGGGAVPGEVARVDAVLNPRTRQIDVDIRYRPGAILSGEAISAAIATGEASGWIVPHPAVALDAAGHAQLFQLVGGKARAVPVRVLVTQDTRDLVAGNLDPGAPLIVDGAFQVADGDAVRVARR
ncbi:MAG: efflux RND transporter periplasmic adaptor subunit [Sphingomonadales bacterium]|nr:efflux RND transporter periplasmic adaptor subunit [Sphingomonadales bacterium]